MGKEWISEMGGSRAVAVQIAPAGRMAIAGGGVMSFVEDEGLSLFTFERDCERAALNGVFTGDQKRVNLHTVQRDIVGYGQNEDAKDIDLLGVEGLGAFFFGDDKKEADAKAAAFANGAACAERPASGENGGRWQRLKGKVAVVTGSAQGFGDGIARELAAAGAHVVIADLNAELAAQNARDINEKYGEGRALAVAVNVADEEAVANMIGECVLHYGGLDLFVSNAGVLKAGGLEEMSLEDFEFVTKINYTAFFLCTKHAARVMKLQRRFRPDYTMDIIQINSKSGLVGSNRNFAYAGGKFGGIGLVASFAKELVGENIKVNAICPGNYYEGPLWSHPEKGLFKQYLEAGKVQGAKSVADVKAHYMGQVPMGRGCYPADVARAIFYCVEQEYETGQAIPVTGGQVMLH